MPTADEQRRGQQRQQRRHQLDGEERQQLGAGDHQGDVTGDEQTLTQDVVDGQPPVLELDRQGLQDRALHAEHEDAGSGDRGALHHGLRVAHSPGEGDREGHTDRADDDPQSD